MPNAIMLFLTILLIILPVAIQLAIFKLRIRQGGFDPSLVTFSSPLSLKNFLVARVLVLLGVVLSLIDPNIATAIFIFTLSAAVFHLAILLIFGRQHTQPIGYYILLAVVSASYLASNKPFNHLAPVILLVLAEWYLKRWKANYSNRYNRWVCRLALKIDSKFHHQRGGFTFQQWRWIVHIATTEQIARPAIVRLGERMYFFIKRPRVISTGIMQIAAPEPMSDEESVRRGGRIVADILSNMPSALKTDADQLVYISKHYNGSTAYAKYVNATLAGLEMALPHLGSREC